MKKKSKNNPSFVFLCFFPLLMLMFSCVSSVPPMPEPPLHIYYREIRPPKAAEQISRKPLTVDWSGVSPIKKIHFRQSILKDRRLRRHLPENFSLLEVVDAEKAEFVIYLSLAPESPLFIPLLAHEVGHLLNPEVFDWFMEGVCHVFSREQCLELGLDRNWNAFHARLKECDVIVYDVVSELYEIVGEQLWLLPHHTRPWRQDSRELQLDIESWLATLPAEAYEQAFELIVKYQDENPFVKNEIPGQR